MTEGQYQEQQGLLDYENPDHPEHEQFAQWVADGVRLGRVPAPPADASEFPLE